MDWQVKFRLPPQFPPLGINQSELHEAASQSFELYM